MTTIAAAATRIADQLDMDHDEALTLATTYAIQLDVQTSVQEGGQAPQVEITDDIADAIVEAATQYERSNTTEILTKAFSQEFGVWQTIDREPGTASDFETADLSATDLGCEPGTEYQLQLVDDEDRVLDERTVTAL